MKESSSASPKSPARRRRVLRVLALLLLLAVLLSGLELYRSNRVLKLRSYTVYSGKLKAPIRVVYLSDLHGKEFGTDNQDLLELIAAQEPDLITLGGDIFNNNADGAEIDAMCALIRRASALAPVYFCMGNHEAYYVSLHGSGLEDRIREAGAVILDSEYVDLELNGNPVRLGGYMGFYRQPAMMSSGAQIQRDYDFMDAFESSERFKLLLNHIPTSWIDWNYRSKYAVDLVLCGHYHGGVIRIPLLKQGLFAPYVGWFPPYTEGLFQGEKAVCILSTGLAGHGKIPRFFNPPELCVVDLLPG